MLSRHSCKRRTRLAAANWLAIVPLRCTSHGARGTRLFETSSNKKPPAFADGFLQNQRNR